MLQTIKFVVILGCPNKFTPTMITVFTFLTDSIDDRIAAVIDDEEEEEETWGQQFAK